MSAKIVISLLLLSSFTMPFLYAQQGSVTIQPTPSEEIVLAIADVQPLTTDKAGDLSEVLKTFNQVLWDDLAFSGFFTLAGKSFYPPAPIVHPQDVNFDTWSVLPQKVSFLTAGTLDISGGVIKAELRIFDMKQRTMSFGQRISGDTDQIRSIAHRWADEIVYQLTAGSSKGIATTKIACTTRKGNAKEITVMDYDGYNLQAFTHTNSLNLFPNWAPDNSKLAFVSFRTGKPEINIYSFIDGSRIPFPMFNSMAITPAISPSGKEIVFSLRTPRGDSDLFISNLDADGSNRHNITNNPAADTAPAWSPSGRQIAFSSGRNNGVSQIFICDADGSNVRQIVKEGGDSDSPAWSPDGKWVAFQWKPHMSTGYDIFIAEVVSGKIRQLTSSGGSNENPTWSPDSRHIAFQSNRTGSPQIYIQLLDGTELRMITKQGSNTSPAWSNYFRKIVEK
jgi:TolB protein